MSRSSPSLHSDEELHFLIPPNLPDSIHSLTKSVLAPPTLPPGHALSSSIKWESSLSSTWSIDEPILSVRLPSSSGAPTQIAWHNRGDYIATVCKYMMNSMRITTKYPCIATGGIQNTVWIHQMSRRHSQAPFRKVKGSIQAVLFHPTKPHFFVAVSFPALPIPDQPLTNWIRLNYISASIICPSKNYSKL